MLCVDVLFPVPVQKVNLGAWIVTLIIMLCHNAPEISEKFTNRVYLFTRVLGPILSIPSFIITFFSDSNDWYESTGVLVGIVCVSALSGFFHILYDFTKFEKNF